RADDATAACIDQAGVERDGISLLDERADDDEARAGAARDGSGIPQVAACDRERIDHVDASRVGEPTAHPVRRNASERGERAVAGAVLERYDHDAPRVACLRRSADR